MDLLLGVMSDFVDQEAKEEGTGTTSPPPPKEPQEVQDKGAGDGTPLGTPVTQEPKEGSDAPAEARPEPQGEGAAEPPPPGPGPGPGPGPEPEPGPGPNPGPDPGPTPDPTPIPAPHPNPNPNPNPGPGPEALTPPPTPPMPHPPEVFTPAQEGVIEGTVTGIHVGAPPSDEDESDTGEGPLWRGEDTDDTEDLPETPDREEEEDPVVVVTQEDPEPGPPEGGTAEAGTQTEGLAAEPEATPEAEDDRPRKRVKKRECQSGGSGVSIELNLKVNTGPQAGADVSTHSLLLP
uniref:L2 n=1 Tax=Archaeolacerta bedriagae papillomavirus 1 TaxID=2859883 RepID=A0A8F6UA88_9PAPI|nr:L2 [Archaeolacerta bedriagae papillomavirus 1]